VTTSILQSTIPNTASSVDVPDAVLLPYQQAWIEDKAPLKVMEKSRRIGITWAESADNVLTAASQNGSNVFYISATQDMALEYIEACAMWARAYDMAAGEIEESIFKDGDKEIQTYRILFPKSGHRVVGLSSSPSNLRGKQGVIVLDEGAFQKSLAELQKAAMAMLMWGDKVRILSTHNGADNPFNELIEEIRAGKRKGSVHRVTFNEAVAQGLYHRVCLRRGIEWTAEGERQWVADVRDYYGDDADEELDVIPSQGGGRYLPLSLIDARMSADTPIVREKWALEFAHEPDNLREAEIDEWCEEHLKPILSQFDKELNHNFGEDFARIGDLTVITVSEQGRDLVNRQRIQVELAQCPYRQQEQILFYIVDRLPRFSGGALDNRGNGGYLAERAQQRYGSTHIECVDLSEKFYIENMPRFKAHLEDATLTDIPRDRETRDDLRAIQRINGVPKIPKVKTQASGKRQSQRHGDSAIALFLCNYAATSMDPAPIEWTAAPLRKSRWDEIEIEVDGDDDDDVSFSGEGAW